MSLKLFLEIVGSAAGVKTMLDDVAHDVDGTERKTSTSFDKLAGVGKVAFTAIAGSAAVGAVAFSHMAADFETSTEQLVTGAGETQKNLGTVQKGILGLMGQVGDSSQELVDGMYHIESAGYHGSAGLTILKTAAQGAKVGNASLDTVSKALVGTMNSFHMPASDATKMMNELIATTASGDMRMEDLASSLGNVIPIAAKAGLSYAQVGGAVATMTAQNMSAKQSVQDIANTIRELQNPNSVAVNEMAQLGLSSNQVATDLGKKGLSGTLNELVLAITQHMGPAGTMLLNSFNQSQTAAQDANAMIAKMPASMQSLAKSYLAGTITAKDWQMSLKELPADQANLATQFATTANKAHGFNDQLKSGLPAAQTFSAALAKMTGGSTGLNTSLMLTGSNAPVYAANIAKIQGAADKSGKSVNGWSTIQKTFNQELADAKGKAEALGITIGMKLLPIAKDLLGDTMDTVTWFGKHKVAAAALAGVVGGTLSIAMGAYFLKLGRGLKTNAVELKKFGSDTLGMLKTAGQRFGLFAEETEVALDEVDAEVETTGTEIEAMGAEGGASLLEMGGDAMVWAGEMLAAGIEASLPFLPWIALIALVGLAAYELYKHWDAVWGFIKKVIGDGVDFVRHHLTLVASIVAAPIAPLVYLATHWRDVWHGIQDVTAYAETEIRDVGHGIEDVFDDVRHGVDDLERDWDSAWRAVERVAVTDVWDGALRPAWRDLEAGVDDIRDVIRDLEKDWDKGWHDIEHVAEDVWHDVEGIFHDVEHAVSDITGALGGIAHIGSSIGGGIGKLGSLLGFADGGTVPGPKGAPMLAIVHGGEFVVSNAMQQGAGGAGGGVQLASGGAGSQVNLYVNGAVLSTGQDLVNLLYQVVQQDSRRNGTSGMVFSS